MNRLKRNKFFFRLLFPPVFYLTGISPAVSENLLKDSSFEWGYEVMSPQKDIYTNWVERQAIHYGVGFSVELKKEPVWRLGQWGSDKSLAGVKSETLPNGSQKWKLIDNNIFYKSITLDNKQGVSLELNALPDFQKNLGKEEKNNNIYLLGLDKYWPHLLLAQNIQSKNLTEYKSVNLSLDARLLFDHNNKQAEYEDGYKKSLHAARYPIAIAVRNTLSKSMFWLMLVVYDERYEKSEFGCKRCTVTRGKQEDCRIPSDLKEVLNDQSLSNQPRWVCPLDGERWDETAEKKGTQKMIFRVPTHAFTQDNIHKGEWAHYQINLLPYIEAGIQAARDNPTLGGFSEGLRFYDLSFFSMGWEITGLNHSALTVKNLSLEGESIQQ